MGRVVVLDGPAGSGKSTTAIELAKRLNYIYLDTGAMYRALTVKFLRSGRESIDNAGAVLRLLAGTKIDIKPSSDGLRIYLDGEDVTAEIRSNEVDGFVSDVSAVDRAREYLQVQQRRFAENYDIVAEGRDLGTYVFPDADVKIFLVADLDVRAKRRMLQKDATDDELIKFKQNLAKRDKIDSGRSHSPLKKADDAIEVDTTGLTFNEQVSKILEICHQKLK
jgi:cytidylate kinase